MNSKVSSSFGNITINLQPKSFDEVIRFAEIVAKTNLIPEAYQRNPAGIVAAVIWGDALGLSPMPSLQAIAPGPRPFMWGDGLVAICRNRPDWDGMEERLEGEGENMVAYCTCKRKGQPSVTRSFSMKDAQRASLTTKKTWQQYPQRMLPARARGFAIRDQWQDALMGLITEAEARDFPAREDSEEVTVPISATSSSPLQPVLGPALIPETPPVLSVMNPSYDVEVEGWLVELAICQDIESLKKTFEDVKNKIKEKKDAVGLAVAVAVKNALKGGDKFVSDSQVLSWIDDNNLDLPEIKPIQYGTVVLFPLSEVRKHFPNFPE